MSSRRDPSSPPCLFSGAVTGDYPPDLYQAFRALGEVLATADVPGGEEPPKVVEHLKLEATAATARELAACLEDEDGAAEYLADGEYRAAYLVAGGHQARHFLGAFAGVADTLRAATPETVWAWVARRGREPLGSFQDLLAVLALTARHLARVVRDGAETLRPILPPDLDAVQEGDREGEAATWCYLLSDSLTAGLAVFIADAERLAAGDTSKAPVEERQRIHREVDPKAYRREGGAS
jgi:hypothetical protein